MPRHTPEQIYAAARVLLPDLPEPLRQQVQTLLTQSEGGVHTHLQLLDLLSADESTRPRLRALLVDDEATRTLGDFTALPGSLPSTPGETYVCPVEGCGYQRVIAEIGEDPGECPIHHQRL
ncbi:MAG: hypothetical protein ACP5QU_08345, partial [Anaerolineae bacterium]